MNAAPQQQDASSKQYETPQNFIHLHLHSAYSLAEGAIKIDELVSLCQANQMPAVAITDSNNLFGALEFAIKAKKSGIQPIIGCKVSTSALGEPILLLVQDEQGYRNLCKVVSTAYMEGDGQSNVFIDLDELREHNQGLICLTGGLEGMLSTIATAEKNLNILQEIFPKRLYIELQRHGAAQEDKLEDHLIDLAYQYNIPLVATNGCYFTQKNAHEAHDALLCISDGRYITEEDRRRVSAEQYFKSSKEMIKLFQDLPEAILNTTLIAKRCSFLLTPIDPILPPFATEGGRSEIEELKAQAEEGLRWRLKNFVQNSDNKDISSPYWDRLSYELDVITQMGFPGYFLIVSDFIVWAKKHNIPVGPGRGSGAGSVVAWALKITDLDPLALNLLFERFLNPERVSMPDFDIDFCQERRDEVIKYVQERYGYDHVAQIITFGKLQARAVVRDVGRVLQMPYGQVDRIAKMIPNNPANPTTLKEALDADPEFRAQVEEDDTTKKLIDIALKLEGLYRHASTHAAGVVISDRPLHQLVPVYRDPRSDMPVTQFNMKYVEQAGLVKFDFLGLKTMTVIQKTVELIKRNQNKDIEILQIPFEDDKTYEMLRKGDNTGVFQLESSGMRDLGKQMKISSFEQIIALVALYRPGPMENIPKYLACLHGKEERDYMHDKLKPYLEETYGIMIYQEQVMQAAQVLSGYTLGGADLLRRAMGKKIQAEMDAQRELFVKGAGEHSEVEQAQANHIFDQIAKFAGYGFNKAHSAGYALIAYWTAWLKANYPVEFMAASMTLDMGNTDKLSIFKQDLDYLGITLKLPSINTSYSDFAVKGPEIFYALAAIKGVGEGAMRMLIEERKENGPYADVMDFVQRIDPRVINKKQFEQLACAGAFDVLEDNRARLHSNAEFILKRASSLQDDKETGQVSLFEGQVEEQENALNLPQTEPWNALERLSHEFGAIGFYLSAHPLDSRQQQFQTMGIKSFIDVEEVLRDKNIARFQMAGVVLKKQEKVSQKGSKYAFLQLSDPTGVYEVTLFSELLHEARPYLELGNTVLLSADAEQREDQIRFTASKIQPLEEALEGKIRTIQIHLSDIKEPLSKLQEFLDIEGKGSAQIELHLDLGDETKPDENNTDNDPVKELSNKIAVLGIEGRWSLSSQARNILRSVQGVTNISEI